MPKPKKPSSKKALRLVVSVILGAVAGVACWQLGKSSVPMPMTLGMILGTIVNRTFIGFAIGISGWKNTHYLLHGLVMGLIFSLGISLYPLIDQGNVGGFVALELAGAFYGVVIEFVVTKLLKAPIE